MYKIDDYVVYRNDVCKIISIKQNGSNDCINYVMKPIDDESLLINVPIDNRNGLIRNIISKEEANNIIDSIPTIDLIEEFNEKNIENIYKELINKGSHKELVQIIKTSYLRNDERIKNKKRISDKDDKYFKLAEKYLYNELSVALKLTVDETKKYIIEKVLKANKN